MTATAFDSVSIILFVITLCRALRLFFCLTSLTKLRHRRYRLSLKNKIKLETIRSLTKGYGFGIEMPTLPLPPAPIDLNLAVPDEAARVHTTQNVRIRAQMPLVPQPVDRTNSNDIIADVLGPASLGNLGSRNTKDDSLVYIDSVHTQSISSPEPRDTANSTVEQLAPNRDPPETTTSGSQERTSSSPSNTDPNLGELLEARKNTGLAPRGEIREAILLTALSKITELVVYNMLRLAVSGVRHGVHKFEDRHKTDTGANDAAEVNPDEVEAEAMKLRETIREGLPGLGDYMNGGG